MVVVLLFLMLVLLFFEVELLLEVEVLLWLVVGAVAVGSVLIAGCRIVAVVGGWCCCW